MSLSLHLSPFRGRTSAPTRPGSSPTPAAPAPDVRLPEAAPPVPSSHRAPPPRRQPTALVLLVLAALAAGTAWYVISSGLLARPAGPLTASGTIEADEVVIGSEVTGRIVSLPAEEGGRVRAGDIVATLDDALLQLQLSQVDAATQRQLVIQLAKYELRAPGDGVITRVPARVGELALPGTPVVAFADLRRLKVTVYVLERDLGQVQVGQAVRVTADPMPDRAFYGVVTSINQRAEFTPRNIQTQPDRLNLVFGVKLRVENPDYALKPGMPIDAVFAPLDAAAPAGPR